MISTTVTVAEHVDEFPDPSVTVSVTAFEPVFAQVKVLGETDKVTGPQLSEDPLSTWAAVMLVFPVASN